MILTGWKAVARAADLAAKEREEDPTDTSDETDCPELNKVLEAFYDDPITIAYGVGSECAPLVIRAHRKAHGC